MCSVARRTATQTRSTLLWPELRRVCVDCSTQRNPGYCGGGVPRSPSGSNPDVRAAPSGRPSGAVGVISRWGRHGQRGRIQQFGCRYVRRLFDPSSRLTICELFLGIHQWRRLGRRNRNLGCSRVRTDLLMDPPDVDPSLSAHQDVD